MALFSNIFSTIKSAFQPAPAPTNILTPEAQARLAITTPGTAGARVAALPPVLQPPPPTPTPRAASTPLALTAIDLIRTGGIGQPVNVLTPAAQARLAITTPGTAGARIAATTPPPPAPPSTLSSLVGAIGKIPEIAQTVVREIPIASQLQRGLLAAEPLGFLAAKGIGAAAAGAVGTAVGGLGLLFDPGSYVGRGLKDLSRAAFGVAKTAWSAPEKERFNNEITSFNPPVPGGEKDEGGAIAGTKFVADPTTGERKVVLDQKTSADGAADLNVGTTGVLLSNENRRAAEAQTLIEQQNENAINSLLALPQLAGMDRATLTELIQADPGVRILYDEAYKKALAFKDAEFYEPSDKGIEKIEKTQPPGFNALEAFKAFMDAAGVATLNKDIKDFEEDFADVTNFYQTRRDEIRDNPEYPQWLKARRDEFVGKAQDRALTLYENKLKALKEDRDRREKLAINYYNASLDQYKLDQQAKRDALDEADTLADNDRALLADYMNTFAEQGINWNDLTFEQQENIRRQFIDPGAVEALGTFDFKSTYDTAQALDWARVTNAGGYKPTTTTVGDTVYQVTYDANKNPIYTPLGRSGSPTETQSRQDFLTWAAQNSGKFTAKQLETVAYSIISDYTPDTDPAIARAIKQHKSITKEGGFLGMGAREVPTTTEDPTTSFSNYQQGLAFRGTVGGGITDTGAGGQYKIGDIVEYNGVRYVITGFDADGTIIGDPI